MKIPMLDLTEQYQLLKPEIMEALEEVMSTASFILGKNVKKLEEDIAELSKAAYGIGVANGSDALHISLIAAGIQAGDEVITSAFTFFATAGAIARIGATPVFVDIDPQTYNMNVELVEAKITDKTKAILPVHLYGQMTQMAPIRKLADKYNLTVIEDAAQSIGARNDNFQVSELSDAACYSFFPTKNLGAYGDAGMIVTSDKELAERMQVIRVHGSKPKYYHHVLGYNSRLDELQAAILNVKFNYLNKWIDQRREIASNYHQLLRDYVPADVKAPFTESNNFHVYHQYTIRVKNREELQNYLKDQGVSTMIYYPLPLHVQPVFKELCYAESDLPETTAAAKEVLSLPMYPELKPEQQTYIVSKIKEFYNRLGER